MMVNKRCRVCISCGRFLMEAEKRREKGIHTSAESLQTICTQSLQLTQAMT